MSCDHRHLRARRALQREASDVINISEKPQELPSQLAHFTRESFYKIERGVTALSNRRRSNITIAKRLGVFAKLNIPLAPLRLAREAVQLHGSG
jgi:hypothetical protein